MTEPTLGFILLRHVNSKVSDLYWKESYARIRKFYPEHPIMIIDDASNPEFLNESIHTTKCTVIYNTQYKGAGELLPYYYFHLLHPFDVAVILHDSVFLNSYIEFSTNDPVRFLWSFTHQFDHEIFHHIDNLLQKADHYDNLIQKYHKGSEWLGCFGVMSSIHWDFLDKIQKAHSLFQNVLPFIQNRANRHGLERFFAVLCYYNQPMIQDAYFGNIHKYCRWGVTFWDYLTQDMSKYPIVKVWSGR
jgi:hypothetical protein